MIELNENDFREINDKIGGIRSAALLAKMSADNERANYLNDIIRWAQDITLFLNNGVVVPEKPVQKKDATWLRFLVRIALGEYRAFQKLSDAQEYAAEIGSEVEDMGGAE